MPAVPRWSVEEYERMAESGLVPRPAELIRGIIVEKLPRSPLHVYLSKWIYDHFLERMPPDYMVFQRAPLRLADSEPEPDITVVRGERAKPRREHPSTALLAITVVTAGAVIDGEYALLYAEADVPEYWMILAEAQQVRVMRQPVDGKYREQHTYGVGDLLVCCSAPGLTVVVAELFG